MIILCIHDVVAGVAEFVVSGHSSRVSVVN